MDTKIGIGPQRKCPDPCLRERQGEIGDLKKGWGLKKKPLNGEGESHFRSAWAHILLAGTKAKLVPKGEIRARSLG